MGEIKIGLIVLTCGALIGLILGGVVMAQPLFEEKSFDRTEYVQDEIIVKFKGDLKPFRVIKVSEGKVREKIKEYLEKVEVEYAEPNYIARTFMTPNDPYYNYQWHLSNAEYGGINIEPAWDISTGGGVIVAIIDTGIAYENYQESWFKKYYRAPDLAETCFIPGYDFVYNDTHPNDDNSHGTHVAGTVAQSTNNNLGVAGAAFDTCLMPIKVLDKYGSGTYANLAKGIRFAADNGAQVINLSLGGPNSSSALEEAVAYAYNKGVTIVAAAGNDGSSIIAYPATYNDYVIAVGATQYDQNLAPYSNYGSSLDLVAPGGNLDLDQNNDGYGDGVLQNTFNPQTKNARDFSYWFFQGTSMATPHVSAVAALLLANGSATGPDEVRAALQETAEDLGSPGRDNTYGWGLIDAFASLSWVTGPDSDGDGVIDSEDACPTVYGTYCHGCLIPTCSGCQVASCPTTGVPVCLDQDALCTAFQAIGTCNDGVCFYLCNLGYGNCDSDWTNGCEVNLATDSNNCGSCGNSCGTISCPESDCGQGGCSEEEYGTYPIEQQTACIESACSGECLATCQYSATCDPDDDNDGVLDVNDACPTTYGTDCNGCPNPCFGCAVISCNIGTLNPPTCLAGTCPDTICPTDGCGVGTCASNEYGTYTPASNVCEIVEEVGTCTENPCALECLYSEACEVPAIKCWSGENQYLYRNSSQARKFCKCAQGTYGYQSYNYNWRRETVYRYLDSGDNENWEVTSRSSYLPVYNVRCLDGNNYPTNQDYYSQ